MLIPRAALKPASSPIDASTALPQAAVTSGAFVALPTPTGAPDLPVPLPKQRRGGDVKNPPYAPVPAVNHLANVVANQPPKLGLMWEAHVVEVQQKLHQHGIERTDQQVDTAIQGARESVHDEDGVYPNIDTGYGWWLVQERMAHFLDVDYDLIVEVAP